MTDYASYSFWLETAGDDLTPRKSLAQSTDVDVAIVGGGYTGLWTAYYLLKQRPDLRVAVVEKEIVGFGASGRNGGWCSSKFPVTASLLEKRFGSESARALLLAMFDSVDEVGRVCRREGINANFDKTGILSLARNEYQLPMIQATHAAYTRLGLGDRYQLLRPAAVADRVKITKVLGALFTPEGARLHPGRLVRGLARVIERLGGTIFEQTPVLNYTAGSAAALRTPGGELRAKKAIVFAGEAYLSRLRNWRRSVVPMYSLITLTEPITDQQWSQIGWAGAESIGSNAYSVEYLSRTPDGRILFGGRGAPYQWGSRITDAQDRHAPTHSMLEEKFRDWFPDLTRVGFTHNWGGPVGMPRDWMPSVSFNPDTKVATAHGYTGQGVATANLTARVLSGLVNGTPQALHSLPLAQRTSPSWEHEPLRWMAIRYMQDAFRRIDTALEHGKPEPFDARLAYFLGRH